MTIAVGDSLPEVELRMMLDHYQQTKTFLSDTPKTNMNSS